jgi:hypothetical protein
LDFNEAETVRLVVLLPASKYVLAMKAVYPRTESLIGLCESRMYRLGIGNTE